MYKQATNKLHFKVGMMEKIYNFVIKKINPAGCLSIFLYNRLPETNILLTMASYAAKKALYKKKQKLIAGFFFTKYNKISKT